ncbi:MAG: hypothetical protein ACRCWR_12805, partial [Saezia sp.]
VAEAKTKTDISIAPGRLNGKLQSEPQFVKFHVQVETVEENSKEKGISGSLSVIRILKSSADLKSKDGSSNTVCQTLEFSVPIFLQAKKSKE